MLWVLLVAVQLVACQSRESSSPQVGNAAQRAQKGGGQEVRELIRMVLDKQPEAALRARQVGPGANAELIKLTRNDDPKVRRIALYCLEETGGADAAGAFARLVLDEDPQVQAAALKGLGRHPDPAVYRTLLEAYDESPAPYVRQQIMLIIGRMPGVAGLAEIKKRYSAEKDPEAREGPMVALARLDDQEVRVDFISRLHASAQRERARYLEYCRYIHAPWLLRPLLPLLDDKTPMVRIGVDARPEWPEYLRACDIVVNLVASISKHSFSFPIAGNTNYSDAQLAEVKAFLQSLK